MTKDTLYDYKSMNVTYVNMLKGVPEGCTPIHLYLLIIDDDLV